jgi:hypothetical protein
MALKITRLLQYRNANVQIVLHGLSGVVGKRYRHPIRRFQETRTALSFLSNKNIQYLVLEQSVRDAILKNLPCQAINVEALDHPISPTEGASGTIDLRAPVRFGFLGTTDTRKGFPVFVQLANEVTSIYPSRSEFHVIGRLTDEGKLVSGMEALTTKPAGMQLTRSEFIQGISPLHYVVLPYEVVPYTLSASGVLLDAVAWEKPIIARRMPIFEAMFEKHGDIGYLFSDAADLRDIVEQILQAADGSRYCCQVLNLRSVRKSRDPEMLAAAYREFCRNT